MSSRFAAAICCGLLRMQTEMGVAGPAVEIGPFEGRFFIAIAHALAAEEMALGIDLFDWPNAEVIDRFRANCARHGLEPGRHIAWKADSRVRNAAGMSVPSSSPPPDEPGTSPARLTAR